MSLRHALPLFVLRRLISTPHGRAHVLTMFSESEHDEHVDSIFGHALSYVRDPELLKWIKRHYSDEMRHQALLRSCLARAGATVPGMPTRLRLLDLMDRAFGGVLTRPMACDRDLLETYLALQVLEERTLGQYPLFERAFREVDPETAAAFSAIIRDEARHLAYCRDITRRYARDEAERGRILSRFRAIESGVFAEYNRTNLDYVLSQGYLDAGPVLKPLLWAGNRLSRWLLRAPKAPASP